MEHQARMLQRSVYQLSVYHVTREPSEHLYRVAHRHSAGEIGVAPELYDVWLDALVATVAEHDPEFSAEVELAWRMAFAEGITLMKHYYTNPLPGPD